jgi:hypothetical protein
MSNQLHKFLVVNEVADEFHMQMKDDITNLTETISKCGDMIQNESRVKCSLTLKLIRFRKKYVNVQIKQNS